MAKILKGLEKKLKKFTRLTTIKFKAPRAHEIKKALEEISNSIKIYLHSEVTEKDFKEWVERIFKSTALRKYYKPGENDKQSYRRSGLAGLIFQDLYDYLTTGFINNDPNTKEPDWFKCHNKNELKNSFERIYSNNNSRNDAWIGSVLYNTQVLTALCNLIEQTTTQKPAIQPKLSHIASEFEEKLRSIYKKLEKNNLENKNTKLKEIYYDIDELCVEYTSIPKIILIELRDYLDKILNNDKTVNTPDWFEATNADDSLEDIILKKMRRNTDPNYVFSILNSDNKKLLFDIAEKIKEMTKDATKKTI